MFYAVQATLLSKGLSYSSHKSVISSFGEQFVKTGVFPREMGRQVNLAFQKRQLGDYEAAFVISKEDAETLHEGAVRFVDTVAQSSEPGLAVTHLFGHTVRFGSPTRGRSCGPSAFCQCSHNRSCGTGRS